jgi:S1-C subfamily serine protease
VPMMTTPTKPPLGKAVVALVIIALVLSAGVAYFAYQASTTTSQDASTIRGLQGAVSTLQGNNAALQAQLSVLSRTGNTTGSASALDPQHIYSLANRSVVTVAGDQVTTVQTFFGPRTSVAAVLGSGFVVSFLGKMYVITNFHVVDRVTNMTVTFANGDSYAANAVGTDPYSDLAVVNLTAPSTEFVPLQVVSSSTLGVGDWVFAIGNPFGLEGSFTIGIVSQLGRTIQESTAGSYAISGIIQFSAPINPGNSGGPLLNSNGVVVGITTAVVSGSQGLGFAIPSSTILRELPSLVSNGGYKLHPYLGISGEDMNYQVARAMGTSTTYGVLLAQVTSGGPAQAAGLRGGSAQTTIDGQTYAIGGDLIVSVNGTRVVNQDALSTYLEQNTSAGQTVQLGIIRAGQSMTISVVLGTRP